MHPVHIRHVHLLITDPGLDSVILRLTRSRQRKRWDIHSLWSVPVGPLQSMHTTTMRSSLRSSLGQRWGGFMPHLVYAETARQTPVLMGEYAVFLLKAPSRERYLDWVVQLSDLPQPTERVSAVETKTLDLKQARVGNGTLIPISRDILRYYLEPKGLGT